MNQSELIAEIRKSPDFYQKETTLVSVDDVATSDEEGQARQCGHSNAAVETLASDIAVRGQQVPITVEKDADGNLMAVDGNHRLKALRELRERHPDSFDYETVRVHERKFASTVERLQWQAKANEHLPSRRNSKEDIVHITKRLMASSDPKVPSELQGGHGNKLYLGDPEKYIDVLKEYLKNNYHLSAKERTSVARDVCKDFPNQKLKNYSKAELDKAFSGNNPIGWEKAAVNGEAFNGWKAFSLGQPNHIFPQITGNSFKAKTRDPAVKSAVIIWDSNPFGKTGSKLDDYRARAIKSLNEMNNSHLLESGTVLADKVFLAPQKIGEEIQESGFYEIDLDDNGLFPTNFPCDGWDE